MLWEARVEYGWSCGGGLRVAKAEEWCGEGVGAFNKMHIA